MERPYAPNEFFRIPQAARRAWGELWRLLADGRRRLASREGEGG
jgi:hypothetical protein